MDDQVGTNTKLFLSGFIVYTIHRNFPLYTICIENEVVGFSWREFAYNYEGDTTYWYTLRKGYFLNRL